MFEGRLTKERLQRLNVRIPSLRVLVEIGKQEGTEFAARLKRWDESGEEGEDSRYIRLTMAEYLEKERSGFRGRQQEPGPSRPPHTANATTQSGVAKEQSKREAMPPQPTSGPATPTGVPDGGLEETRRPGQGKGIISQHVYGGKFAACFSSDVSRGGHSTVRIEVAEANGNSRQYNWADKVSIQLSQRELPLVLATLMQWVPKFEGKGHGATNEKWFTLENQPCKVFLSVNCKGKSARGVPLMAGDTYALCTLIMRQMLLNDPFLSSESLLMLVKTQAAMLSGPDWTESPRQRSRAEV